EAEAQLMLMEYTDKETIGILLFKPLFHISKGGLIGDAHFPLAFHFLQVFLGGRQQSDKGFHLFVSQGFCLGRANLDFRFYIWKHFAQFLYPYNDGASWELKKVRQFSWKKGRLNCRNN